MNSRWLFDGSAFFLFPLTPKSALKRQPCASCNERAFWTIDAHVKLLLEMPGDQFEFLITNCTSVDRVYAILKNGLVTPYGENNGSSKAAVILCDEADAKLVIALARNLSGDLARQIRQYPAKD